MTMYRISEYWSQEDGQETPNEFQQAEIVWMVMLDQFRTYRDIPSNYFKLDIPVFFHEALTYFAENSVQFTGTGEDEYNLSSSEHSIVLMRKSSNPHRIVFAFRRWCSDRTIHVTFNKHGKTEVSGYL